MSFVDILKDKFPIILAATGAASICMAVYEGIKAPTPEQVEKELPEEPDILDKVETYGKAYAKPIAYTGIAIVSIGVSTVLSQKQINDISKNLAAMSVSYAALERKFWTYKDKIRDFIGEEKAEKIEEEITMDEIRAKREHPKCCGEEKLFWLEHHPNREFTDTLEHVREAIDAWKDEYYTRDYGTFDELIEKLDNSDIPPLGVDQGWSRWAGENVFGYSIPTIELKTIMVEESEGGSFEVTVIHIPFEPSIDYIKAPEEIMCYPAKIAHPLMETL